LSFFLASSEASELFKAANAISAPSVGDVSGVGTLGVAFFVTDLEGVAAVELIVTPFLTTLMFWGTSFLLEEPQRYDMSLAGCSCEIEVAPDDEEFGGKVVRK
jgi:hypothetical protein